MEPALIFVVMLSCMVAVGAALFAVMQGSKNANENNDNDETNSET